MSFDGSCDVVTPNARLAVERPARLREDAVPFAADVAVDVDDARHDRLAARVDLLRARRNRHAACPTAAMRLPSTTTVPFSIAVARRRDDPAADEGDRAVGHVGLAR